jgi:hypothetical protein
VRAILSRAWFRTGAVLAILAVPIAAPGQSPTPSAGLNFSGPWTRSDPEARFMPPVSGPGPLRDDPAHPHHGHREGVPGQPDESATPWVADLSNPILKSWVAEIVQRNAAQGLAGVEADTALLHCRPDGVPGVLTRRDNVQLLQTPTEVTIVYQLDHQVRHVYLNVPHSQRPSHSWYGESVGHFEGDTLVVDTIGLNDQTTLDTYNTPHSDALHVVERYHLVDSGRTLQVDFTVDDPVAFNMQWSGIAHYRRSRGAYEEFVCAENNTNIWTGKSYPIPIAATSDF